MTNAMIQTTCDPTVSARAVSDLVDAIVEAVDLGRRDEVDRLRAALEPFELTGAFDDELRLSGFYSEVAGFPFWLDGDDLAEVAV